MRVGIGAAVRRVEGPPGIHPTRDGRRECEHAANRVDIPAQQVQAWKRQVTSPDHHGNQEISEHRRNSWNEEEENHDDAVHREELVVCLRLNQVALRREQFETDQYGKSPSKKKKKRYQT